MAYKTRQREEIAAYLASIPGKHVTAGDVCAHFQAQGSAIGAAKRRPGRWRRTP